jgi:type II secretory pathway pseudopilin PulG
MKTAQQKFKKAFSMVTAIFVIIMMSSLTLLIQNLSSKSIHNTTAQYQKEQAILLARSYTELAILYASSYDRTIDCLNTINGQFGPNINSGGYNVVMELRYIGKDTQFNTNTTPSCYDTATAQPLNARVTLLERLNGGTSFDESISIIIDTYITYKNLDDPSASVANGDRNITVHRRTLQKI